jgi:hypothetical protein
VYRKDDGHGVISLRFEGEGCAAWTPSQCQEYADVIGDNLCLWRLSAKLAVKVKTMPRHKIAKNPATRRARSSSTG